MLKKIFAFVVFLFLIFGSIDVLAKEEYVQNILIDGTQIKDFNSEVTTYNLEVDGSKEKINLIFDYDNTKYNGSGNYGSLNLKFGLNEFKFIIEDNDTSEKLITYAINVTRTDNRSSDNTLATLTVGNNKITLTEKDTYDVFVDSNLTNVSVKATLNHVNSKFVDGYGERTINLKDEKTPAEIKIQAENKDIKTYTINIIKKDFKSNDATLKKLTIDKIPFDFKSDVTEYNLECSYDIAEISITAEANHEKAVIEKNDKVNLKVGLNDLIVKVTAEDNSNKEYKLNVTRLEKTYLVKNIEIDNLNLKFDNKKLQYEVKTELDKINFNVTLNSEDVKLEELNNENLKNNSVITLKASLGDIVETYKFKIKKNDNLTSKNPELIEKKAENEKIEENTKIDINTFLKKNEMIVSLVILGIGVLSILISIIAKAKK